MVLGSVAVLVFQLLTRGAMYIRRRYATRPDLDGRRIKPHDRERMLASVPELLAGELKELMVRVVTRSGETRWLPESLDIIRMLDREFGDLVRFKAIWCTPICGDVRVKSHSRIPMTRFARSCTRHWECRFSRNRRCGWLWWRQALRRAKPISCDGQWEPGEGRESSISFGES